MGKVKTEMEIEKLLCWAFRDELPKRQTSSAEGIWDRIYADGQRGGIDLGHGSAQRYPHFGLPHDDAVWIERAVSTLPDAMIDWGAERDAILGDIAEIMTDAIMVRSLRACALVIMHARMGTRPDWKEEEPRPFQIPAQRGPNAAIVGECWGKNLYSSGSYCPLRWRPSPLSIAESRADYLVWWRALSQLASTLSLSAHTPMPPAAPEMPWRDPGVGVWIFGLRSPPIAEALLLKPQRKLAGPPKRRPKGGPISHPQITD